jgi:hypothetical protein
VIFFTPLHGYLQRFTKTGDCSALQCFASVEKGHSVKYSSQLEQRQAELNEKKDSTHL